MNQSKISVQDLTKMALCVALLIVSGFIRFPVPISPTPVTAQTLMVNLVALILLPQQAAMTVGVYLLLGVVGLPVFGGSGGIGAFTGVSGGFLIGFFVAAVLVSFLNVKLKTVIRQSQVRALLTTIVVGMPVTYLCGCLMMVFGYQMSVPAALMAGVVPFIVGDIIKCVGATVLALALNKALSRSRAAA